MDDPSLEKHNDRLVPQEEYSSARKVLTYSRTTKHRRVRRTCLDLNSCSELQILFQISSVYLFNRKDLPFSIHVLQVCKTRPNFVLNGVVGSKWCNSRDR